MIAVVLLGIMMAFVGHISSSLVQSNRRSDVVAKRTFAMQQQSNIIGAMMYSALTSANLPATKTDTLGDFIYERRITLSSSGTVTTGRKMVIGITIVPQTGIPSDTLLQESLTMLRSSPNCGDVLAKASC